LLTEDEKNALTALKVTADVILGQNEFTTQNSQNILTCLWTILQNPIFSRQFLHWLGDLTKLPVVKENAKKHPFGETGLRIFAKIVRSL